MKIEIPSPVLVRLQVMFNSGMTVQEVTEALELDLIDEASGTDPEQHPIDATEEIEPEIQEAPAVDAEGTEENPLGLNEKAFPAEAVDYLFGLTSAIQDMGAGVYALAGHANVRNSKSLSNMSQNLISSMQTVAKLVNAVNRYVPSADAEEMGPTVAMDRWVVSPPGEKRESPPSSGPTAKPKARPPIPQGVKPNGDTRVERRLKVPQPRKTVMPAAPVAPPTPSSTPTPSNRRTDPPIRKAAPATGTDLQSRIASTLDQIEGVPDKPDGAKRSG